MILVVDNYDSFVHNLARYLRQLGAETLVVRNDMLTVEDVRQWQPAAIVLSPGPCAPDQAGCSLDLVRQLHTEIPMLGVCLGHQTIAQTFGGRVVRASRPLHGVATTIQHSGTNLFAGLPKQLEVGRYHSLVVQQQSLPKTLQPTAFTDDGVLMALEHRQLPLFGVQFHPESVLTQHGYALLANFLKICGIEPRVPRDPDRLVMAPQPAPVDSLPRGVVTF